MLPVDVAFDCFVDSTRDVVVVGIAVAGAAADGTADTAAMQPLAVFAALFAARAAVAEADLAVFVPATVAAAAAAADSSSVAFDCSVLPSAYAVGAVASLAVWPAGEQHTFACDAGLGLPLGRRGRNDAVDAA